MTSELRECLIGYRGCLPEGDVPPSALSLCFDAHVLLRSDEPSTVYAVYDLLDPVCFDGTSATVGAQGPGRLAMLPVLFNAPCALSGTALVYRFGTGTDPTRADTDGDGLDDEEELFHGTDPHRVDTDGDGIPDDWEIDHGLDPLDPDDAALDPDEDGLDNLSEYLNETDPSDVDADGDGVPDGYDSDGDGVDDGTEVANGSDPNDPLDFGLPPTAEECRVLDFHVAGDYAAWEMTVEGLGPYDWRKMHVSMVAPSTSGESAMKCLRKGNSYRLTMRWLNSDGHEDERAPWYCWQAQVDGLPNAQTFDDYSDARKPGVADIVVGDGWIAENASGLLTAHVHECARKPDGTFGGGNVARDRESTLYVLGDPLLVFDYNRDGVIGDDDISKAIGEEVFRFWRNDDGDDGDVCPGADYNSDCPEHGWNYNDDHVNGRRDLVDFTPMWIDLNSVFPVGTPDSIRESVSWKLESSCVNVVWTSLDKDHAGDFHYFDMSGFGLDLSQQAHVAKVQSVDQGKVFPLAFQEVVRQSPDRGVVLIEGRGGNSPLKLVGFCGDDCLVERQAPLSISPVENMYRWLNLRSVANGNGGNASNLQNPLNRPDSECNGTNYVFVHGFNVNPTECRSSAAEMFKRLWQSGLKSMFTVVEWFGDEEQYAPPNLSTFSLNFYVNTLHAFQTASSLASACANLPGQKVMIAHSLGNVLVSAAIKDYGLTYERYYLMNAAVPMEAFDSSAFAIRMITADSAWDSVPRDYCSPKWYMLFSPTDFRSSLSWKGRFSGLQNLVNCYSSTEDVVGNILEGQPLLSRTVWALQETIKGTSYIHVLNGTALFDIACEGGWGVNTYYELNPLWYLNGFTNRILTEGLSRIEQITHPLFTPFRTEAARMHSVDDFVRVDSAEQYQLRAKFLGDAIPAESYAVGANPMSPSLFLGNISLMNCMSNVSLWPEERIVSGQKCWQHSDFKNLAFFYVYKFYEKIVFNEVQ